MRVLGLRPQLLLLLGGLLAVAVAPLQLAMYWHELQHRDPGNRWLRDFVRTTLLGPDAP